VGIEPSSPLQTRKLFIVCLGRSCKIARNAEVRYTAGTRNDKGILATTWLRSAPLFDIFRVADTRAQPPRCFAKAAIYQSFRRVADYSSKCSRFAERRVFSWPSRLLRAHWKAWSTMAERVEPRGGKTDSDVWIFGFLGVPNVVTNNARRIFDLLQRAGDSLLFDFGR
jgi:hypothetical protein